MKIKIIYPKWPKLRHQMHLHLPPYGPVCFASSIPEGVEISFYDENVEQIDLQEKADLVAISVNLTCQLPRAWEIADQIRAQGVPVIFGGNATMMHHEETAPHANSVFLGEAEGHFEAVIADFKNNNLKKVYNYFNDYVDAQTLGPARRSILKHKLYNHRGVRLVDLIGASRGCRFNCSICCAPFLGHRNFRPRKISQVIKELEAIDNNRLYFVDNTFTQDEQWEKELFQALIPLKKRWISNPIKDNDEITDLAAKAGAWYVYQVITDMTDKMKNRVKRLHDRGIGVEGAIIIGMDNHNEDYLKRMVDFFLECKLDLAEFTILTPFPHTRLRAQLEKENRIFHNDWTRYTCDEVVFRPARMSPDKLQEMYDYCWETFYADYSEEMKMAKLFMQVVSPNEPHHRKRQLKNKTQSE